MLGFVVKDIDCSVVISTITNIHSQKIGSIIARNITPIANANDYYLCESVYTNQLSLSHIFYNISSVISS